jgi:hypothetical protein
MNMQEINACTLYWIYDQSVEFVVGRSAELIGASKNDVMKLVILDLGVTLSIAVRFQTKIL